MKIPYAPGSESGWEKIHDTNVFKYFYELLPELYNIKTIAIIGPGKKEEEHLEKFNTIVFEPDEKRAKELKRYNVKVINDMGYEIEKYLPEKSVDAAYAFNIVNWPPFDFLKFLRGVYKVLRDGGVLVFSVYSKIWREAKDKKLSLIHI